MHIQDAITQMNQWGADRMPFFFMIDFEMNKPRLYHIDDLPDHIYYDINGKTNHIIHHVDDSEFTFDSTPITVETYEKAFNIVHDHLQYGNTFLLNLAFPSEINTSLSLYEIYQRSQAKYKLYIQDELVMFSPEIFVQMRDGYIYSYPMKGTIDATAMGADLYLLNDKKEQAEHSTIVDLIRNDLSKVAREVRVTRYRYIDTIDTHKKKLHQVSSEIRGRLPKDYPSQIGTILSHLLPAGSISGAPKAKTLQIIREAEQQDRGYYTGVYGYFDGEKLDSGVMIRYIEQEADGSIHYRSGGGITAMSDMSAEYQELIDKIYVPTYRKHQNFEWPHIQSKKT